jgi:enoyl-CoA hydratase/carnithine racemase
VHTPMIPKAASLDRPLLRADGEGVAVLTLNRPKQYNALSSSLLRALHAEVDAIAGNAAVRVVVIAGNGKAFCAGHDLRELRRQTGSREVARLFRTCSDLMLKLVRLPQPVIAEVDGIATAAGCQLVAQCDLAIGSERARFAVSGINLRLFCSTPAVAISRVMPRKRAAEMLFTGDVIDARQALEWGLLNRVVPAANLRRNTMRLAATLCAKPPRSPRPGQGVVLPPARARAGGGIRGCLRDHDAQYAAPDCHQGRRGVHREAPPRVSTPMTDVRAVDTVSENDLHHTHWPSGWEATRFPLRSGGTRRRTPAWLKYIGGR